jgi:cytochrome c oxidase subunit 2
MNHLRRAGLASALFFAAALVPAHAQSADPAAPAAPVATDLQAPAPAPAITTAAPASAGAQTVEAPAAAAVDTSILKERMAPTPGLGQPVERGIGLQSPVTEIGRDGLFLHNWILMPLMTLVVLVVFALLGYAVVAFRRSRGHQPATWSHNTTIEVIWTAIPALILLGIAFPSFKLLADQYDPPKADLTIKATGHQWYWAYEYPDQGGFGFDAVMLKPEEAAAVGSPNLLDTDNRVVVPVGATVRVLVTAADVLHSWAMPAFWVKMDAVPGRINETWFKAEREGVYFGQCSELCGTRHAFMPIAVEVVSKERFDRWVAARQAEAGIDPAGIGETGDTTETAATQPAAELAQAG